MLLQVTTALILILAANTAFNGFPRLASIVAADGFLPRIFKFRGDRLAYTAGIVVLAVLAAILLLVFNGSVDLLIPLYAVGVFTSFPLSQVGMVVHWRRERTPGWQRAAAINGLGGIATGIVTAVIAITKFVHGAWLVVFVVMAYLASGTSRLLSPAGFSTDTEAGRAKQKVSTRNRGISPNASSTQPN